MRHIARGSLQACLHVVDKVNYGSSLYSELQGGCGRWRRLHNRTDSSYFTIIYIYKSRYIFLKTVAVITVLFEFTF